ncbi:MAG: DHHW family protein [Eubacteriales bacterium]
MNAKSNRIIAFLLCAVTLSCAVLFFVLPRESFSENENRALAAAPSLRLSALAEGDFTADLQDYLTDHFPFRDLFICIRTKFLLLLGRTEINGVYLGRDGALIDRYDAPEHEDRFRTQVAALAEKTPVTLMLVPTAVTVYPENLPAYASCASQTETIERLYAALGNTESDLLYSTNQTENSLSRDLLDSTSCRTVDVLSVLAAHRDEWPLYYRTDHHWTMFGAYCGYLAYCEAKGLTPVPLDAYDSRVVTDDFRGTLYARFGDYTMPGEEIAVFELPGQELDVLYNDTGETSDSLYNFEYLEKRDKYSLFLNNLHSMVTITNESAGTEDALLVIKDSYANSMIPFLTAHYRTIYVVDPRYYREAPSEFAAAHPEISDVLVLYNLGTMDEDAGIGGIR